MSPAFFMNLLSIILIDIVLAGDNSVVIAMAVQSLPKDKKLKGIFFGSAAAVILRIIFTFFAAQLLCVSFVKLIGGVLILWIAVKLMADNGGTHEAQKKPVTVLSAIWLILVADITMSLDNVLAVAGASHGNLFLLIFGFALSIPLVVFASTLISNLMQKYPFIMWIGAAILGKVGAEMIITDPIIISKILVPANVVIHDHGTIVPAHWLTWVCEILGVVGVIAITYFQQKKAKSLTT